MLVSFLALASAQGPGKGISKNTYACSSATTDTVFAFMTTYFPVEEAPDDCDDRTCTCGKQGRVQLLLSDDDDRQKTARRRSDRRRQPPGGRMGFGMHCVYAPGKDDVRWKQSGALTMDEIEQVFVDKFGNMTDYVVEMETNTGLYTSDLSSFASKLDEDDVPYITLKWSSDGTDYMSVLVHPGGQIIHEVISEASTATDKMHLTAKHHKGERWNFGAEGTPNVTGTTMTAMWVSHVTTDASRDADFFKTVFDLESSRISTSSGTDPAGNSYTMVSLTLSSTATTQIRLIQPADTTSGAHSVAWWEKYVADVHKEYMKNANCGWDVLADNHFAYDWHSTDPDQGDIISRVNQAGYTYFCTSGGGRAHCYINTPFGYQVQMDGTYADPPSYNSYDNTDLCATYTEYC